MSDDFWFNQRAEDLQFSLYRLEPSYQITGTRTPIVDTRLETLQARIDAGIEYNGGPIDPQGIVQLTDGETRNYYIENLPTAELRALSGYGHFQPFQCPVIYRPDGVAWAYTPNMCLVAGGAKGKAPSGVWIDEEHLVCPGCGLDCT
jgi:hypothetical protein